MKIKVSRRRIVWIRDLALGLAATASIVIASSTPAYAIDTGGYPDADAVACGSDTWCKGNTSLSSRGYTFNNCTDYVAWRLASLGVLPAQYGGLGNANTWDDNAALPSRGIAQNSIPTVGSVAQRDTGTFGHVAFVTAVNADGTIDIAQYNAAHDGLYSTAHGTPAALGFSNFLHFEQYETLLNSYQAAINSGSLWLYGQGVTTNTTYGMLSGTNPATTKLTTGGYQTAFQANNGHLWVYGSAGTADTGLGMAAGTSPAITALPGGGYQVAFQSSGGTLWTYGSAGSGNTGYGMASGTSPAITAVTGGYEVAFNSGTLWLWGNAGTMNTGYGMATGTSPAITSVGSSYQAAFNSGTLWVVGADGTANSGLGMAAGTSPAIATVGGHFQAAFQSSGGTLWTYGPSGTGNTSYGMAAGTSPAITAVTSGYQVAFNSGTLWLWGNAGTANTGYGMAAGTSPSLTRQ